MIGERELMVMKQNAYLVNIARAHLIDEDALYKALTHNWIAGYGTDVWWKYDAIMRKVSDHPGERLTYGTRDSEGYLRSRAERGAPTLEVSRTGIHKLENVVITADRASWNFENQVNRPIAALRNVAVFARGRTPNNVVDLSVNR